MQTHVATASIASHMALAQRQLSAKGIGFFVNFLVGDGEHDRCPEPGEGHPALDLLRATIGNASVWCVAPSDHLAIWPNFHRNISAFAAKATNYRKPTAIGGIHWAWLLCDLHAMVGAYRHRLFAQPLAPEFLWVFDYDISWVGDLAAFIRAFEHDTSDLLVAKDNGQAVAKRNGRGDLTYAQVEVRNYLDLGEVYSALLAPVRYSRRILAAMRGLVGDGSMAFCETRGPSLCHHKNNSWCRQGSMMELRPDLFNKNFSCCKSHSERYARERTFFWEQIPAATRPPCQLLHRVKLDDRVKRAVTSQQRIDRHSEKQLG